MVKDAVECPPKPASANLLLQLVVIEVGLFWENSPLLHVECAGDHGFVEPRIISLFEIIPAVRRDSAKEVRGCPTEGGETLLAYQFAEMVLASVKQIGGEKSRHRLS